MPAATAEPGPQLSLADEHSLRVMASDFLTVKRLGLGSIVHTLVAVILGFIFMGAVMVGAARRSRELLLLGAFGLLAAIQTLTGFLEFSLYQRAGWFLLESAGWVAALLVVQVYRYVPLHWARAGLSILAGGSLLMSLFRPPSHVNSLSSAENELVILSRALGMYGSPDPAGEVAFSFDRSSLKLPSTLTLDRNLPIVMVSRTFSDSFGRNWEIPDAVLPIGSRLSTDYTDGHNLEEIVGGGKQFVFFLDTPEKIDPRNLGSMHLLSQEGAAHYSEWQYSHYKANAGIRRFLGDIPRSDWVVQHYDLSAHSEVFILTPQGSISREAL
jgi:hypothetical protein